MDLQLEEKLITSGQSSPSSSSSSASTSPVPAIKLQRKCSSGWTFSNSSSSCSSSNSSAAVSKLRRGGVKVKLRSWMAEPLAVKEGDASLRLATDLPRFNWLELKLNQKQDGEQQQPPTSTSNLPIVPLKIRILEKTSYAARLAQQQQQQQPIVVVAQHIVKTEESASEPATSSSSRWPLKKRLIRQENQVSPVVSPDSNRTKPDGSMMTDVRLSPPAQRGPVIMMRNILPPTPPASSAPPEVMVAAADQDKPLDLSKRCEPESFRPAAAAQQKLHREDHKAEVEIIAMTTRINQPPPIRPNVVGGFHQSFGIRQRFAHNPAEIRRIQRNDMKEVKPPLREYSTAQRIPSIRPAAAEPSFPDWNRSGGGGGGGGGFRPYSGTAMQAPTRPFVLPPLRPLPHHWNSLVAQQQRNVIIRPEVQLHPVGQPGGFSAAAPRLFHPQQVTAATTKKPTTTTTAAASHSMTTTLPPDWSLRSCVVCSRRADFRCAGCHGNAYCSTLCQARDWPNHSQLCQRNS